MLAGTADVDELAARAPVMERLDTEPLVLPGAWVLQVVYEWPTMRSSGNVAGTRCIVAPGGANVCESADVMCVALSAATIAIREGGAASGPRACCIRCMLKRM